MTTGHEPAPPRGDHDRGNNHGLLRTKPLAQITAESKEQAGGLKRTLTAIDITAIGVGAMIGAGIFVLTGTAAKTAAGPAIMLSYVFAGGACILAALCYAEFAARLPISGSVYTYSYASVGELFAWIIGWDLILEYTIGASTVAVGWTKYLGALIPGAGALSHVAVNWQIFGWHIDHINILAGLIILGLSALLCIGVKESAQVNSVIVAVKVGVVLFVILAGLFFISPENWIPFTPFGAHGSACPVDTFCWDGIFTGAALIFFSYIGFDAVSTTAEEAKNPQRDLPIGIMASLLICTGLYVAVAGVITGMVPYQEIDPGAPLASAFGSVGFTMAEQLIGIGGVAGLTTVMLILLLSQPRIYFSMARDGLLPKWFATIHPTFRTPINATVLTGIIAAVMAMVAPIEDLHHMVSIGTLFAFMMVCASTLILRYKPPGTQSLKSTWVVLVLTIGISGLFACLNQGWPLPLYGVFAAMAIGATVMLLRMPGLNTLKPFDALGCPFSRLLGWPA